MASRVHVVVVGGPDGLVGVLHTRLRQLEARWSRFLADSDISRLNHAHGRQTSVAPDTVTLVQTMQSAWSATAGRYDPTTLPVLVANGYDRSIEDPSRVTVLPSSARYSGGMGAIEVDEAACVVTLPEGTALDPGGIGKGLAADLGVTLLLDHGARGASVAIGGDIAMDGDPPAADGWHVTVEHPDPTRGDVCTVAVSSGGVATSSTCSRRWEFAGRRHHHLIDPVLGHEADTDLAAVTVIAGRGWSAEAHATAALLEGSTMFGDYLERRTLSGIAVCEDGSVRATADLDADLGRVVIA